MVPPRMRGRPLRTREVQHLMASSEEEEQPQTESPQEEDIQAENMTLEALTQKVFRMDEDHKKLADNYEALNSKVDYLIGIVQELQNARMEAANMIPSQELPMEEAEWDTGDETYTESPAETIAGSSKVIPLTNYFKPFMAAKPPQFDGLGDSDKAEHWLTEIERTFVIIDVPDMYKVKLGTYVLIGEAAEWWKSMTTTMYMNELPTWEALREDFQEIYIPAYIRDQKAEDFLELRQKGKVHEYVTQFRRLLPYCSQMYPTEMDRVKKFIRGLSDGLRFKVLGNEPGTMKKAIEMAHRFEADWNVTNEHILKKRKEPERRRFDRSANFQRRPPYRPMAPPGYRPAFTYPQRGGFRPRPPATSLLSTARRPVFSRPPTPPLCKVCYGAHFGPCREYRGTYIQSEAQGQQGKNFSQQYSSPIMPIQRPPSTGSFRPSSSTVDKGKQKLVAGRVYTATIQDMQGQQLIEG